MAGKDILKVLDAEYCGLETLKYRKRYDNGDNRKKMIHWVMDNFECSWGVANRLVGKANGYIGR